METHYYSDNKIVEALTVLDQISTMITWWIIISIGFFFIKIYSFSVAEGDWCYLQKRSASYSMEDVVSPIVKID